VEVEARGPEVSSVTKVDEILRAAPASITTWKFIKDDLGLREIVGRALEIGWTHVHGNSLDLSRLPPMLAQRLSEALERLGTLCQLRVERLGPSLERSGTKRILDVRFRKGTQVESDARSCFLHLEGKATVKPGGFGRMLGASLLS
jgi:hypothetical protein